MTPEQKKAYKRYMELRRSADSAIQTAEGKGERRGERRGLRKGIEKGLQKGLQKGRQEGLQKGQDLERAKLVKSLYETGLTVAKIVKGTKLSETAVKRILGS
jgi:DNA invertase Pin-like site-specific DNA recombinase